jgi:hypothetical protein
VPGAVLHVPSDFRKVPPGHQSIPYGQLKNNWEIWEKEKHWDKQARSMLFLVENLEVAPCLMPPL